MAKRRLTSPCLRLKPRIRLHFPIPSVFKKIAILVYLVDSRAVLSDFPSIPAIVAKSFYWYTVAESGLILCVGKERVVLYHLYRWFKLGRNSTRYIYRYYSQNLVYVETAPKEKRENIYEKRVSIKCTKAFSTRCQHINLETAKIMQTERDFENRREPGTGTTVHTRYPWQNERRLVRNNQS